MNLINELLVLNEAKAKKSPTLPTFVVVRSFEEWNDKNGGNYDEDEIDGKLVGILRDEDDQVIGMWYNKAKMGTISKDFPAYFKSLFKSRPHLRQDDDFLVYAETDTNWPYDN